MRRELGRDFPQFTLTYFHYYRVDPGWSFDASPYDGYKFAMTLRVDPRFSISGDYPLSGMTPERPGDYRNTLFDGKHLPREQLMALASAWARDHPRDPVLIAGGPPGNSGETAQTALQPISDYVIGAPVFGRVAKRWPLTDIYLLESAHSGDYFWYYLDRAKGSWLRLGTTDELLSRFGG